MPAPTRKLPLSGLAHSLLAVVALTACGGDDDEVSGDAEAAHGSDGGGGRDPRGGKGEDAGGGGGGASDASMSSTDAAGLDAGSADASAPDAAQDAGTQDAGAGAGGGDAGKPDSGGPCTPGVNGCPRDALAPFKLDCANLPSNGVCVGGPREVLLVTEETGMIAMFDPGDGRFLGYFKRRSAKYNLDWVEEYRFADQGPDQCIWTVSQADEAVIERWNTDGSFRDVPLKPHYFDLPSDPPAPLVEATGLAFTRDKVYVASQESAQGYPALTRWNLDGNFDGVALDGAYDIESLLVLGDGSIVASEGGRVVRFPAGGGQPKPILGELSSPGQLAYTGDGGLLVIEESTGEPLHKVDVESGMSSAIYPKDSNQLAKYGIAPLRNGKYLIAGGGYYVSALDPASVNPPGQHAPVFTDPAAESIEFKQIGRACLPEAVVASRASKPANNTCIAPPAGAVLLQANFDGTDDFVGTGTQRHYKEFYDRGTAGVTSSLAAGEGFGGSRALKVAGSGTLPSGVGQGRVNNGVYARLPAGSRPKYVSYRVKVTDAADRELGTFSLHNEAGTVNEYARLLSTDFYRGYLRSLESNAAYDTTQFNVWVQVEFRNIDWTLRSADLYVNCKRLAEGIAIPAGYGDSIDILDLFNYPTSAANDKTVAWYDDIVIK